MDADTLGLAHVLVTIRGDVTYPGDQGGRFKRLDRPPCPITRTRTPDHEWLPVVARHGWLVITRDQNLRNKTVEISTIIRHGAKVVTIVNARTPKGVEPPKLDVFRQLRIVMTHWHELEGLLDIPGPFIYDVSEKGIHKIA
ncbi:MAG TPA: hypothetical protein VM142_08410 [Acidimicrobiales bacterium]|nr:hypothetical protein [Acidimicrobiales bacterium]